MDAKSVTTLITLSMLITEGGTGVHLCRVPPSALLALEPWRGGPGRVGSRSLSRLCSSLVAEPQLGPAMSASRRPQEVISEVVTVLWLAATLKLLVRSNE